MNQRDMAIDRLLKSNQLYKDEVRSLKISLYIAVPLIIVLTGSLSWTSGELEASKQQIKQLQSRG